MSSSIQSFLGLVVLVAAAWLISENRRQVNPRLVGSGRKILEPYSALPSTFFRL